MGGCATKPKVLKEAPAPQPAKEDKPSAAPEPPVDVVVGVTEVEKIDPKEEDDDKVKEIVDDDKVDDQDSKRRSLSILFKENEEGKESTGDGNRAVEPLKQEPPPVNVKPTYESETKVLEVEKTEIPVEKTPVVPDVVDAQKSEIPIQQTPVSEVVFAPKEAESERTIETAPDAETKTVEKKTEVPDVADSHNQTEREKAIEAAPAVETQTNGTSNEAAVAQKAIEVAVGTETQNGGKSEEKKTEAKGTAGGQ